MASSLGFAGSQLERRKGGSMTSAHGGTTITGERADLLAALATPGTSSASPRGT